MSENGIFLVLEGLDGAGTTTQTARLAKWFAAQNRRVHTTREPSDGPIGTLLRQCLRGRVVSHGGRAPGWETMALLFAADRKDHLEAEIEPKLKDGFVVISDRYDASSLAYQSASSEELETKGARPFANASKNADSGVARDGGPETPGARPRDSLAWIQSLNSRARRPDLVLVVQVPAAIAAARRDVRGGDAELYERDELQRRLAVFYNELPTHMPYDRIASVDGTGTPDEVFAELVAAITASGVLS